MIACFCLPLFCSAQQVEAIHGIVYKRGMLEKLAGVSITNLKTQVTTASNLYGEFNARGTIGDTLLIDKQGYTPFKQAITSYSPLYITLMPQITLDQVTIKGQTKKQELSGIMNDYRSKGIYYDGKPPVLAYVLHPTTALYELLGKEPGRARNFARYAKGEQEASEVDRTFTPALVTKLTGLTDTALQLFMDEYRPSHDDLVKWTDYDLIKYIKKSYDGYLKTGIKEKENIFKSNP